MDKTKIINLTAHTINETTTGKSFPPSGIIARVQTKQAVVCNRLDIPVFTTLFGTLEGLPEPKEDTFYIVSAIVLNVSNRVDIMAPGSLKRDENGQAVGCHGFRVNE